MLNTNIPISFIIFCPYITCKSEEHDLKNIIVTITWEKMNEKKNNQQKEKKKKRIKLRNLITGRGIS